MESPVPVAILEGEDILPENDGLTRWHVVATPTALL